MAVSSGNILNQDKSVSLYQGSERPPAGSPVGDDERPEGGQSVRSVEVRVLVVLAGEGRAVPLHREGGGDHQEGAFRH